MDAITLLKNDHKTVEGLFKRFEKAGDNAHKTKAKLVEQIIRELSIHASIEELAFYPFIKGVNETLTEDVLESLEEHHVAKWLLSELDGLSPTDERFDAKVTVLIENVRHHVEEEEKEMFPAVRKALSRSDLDELGDVLARAKKVAPVRPHPRSPDEPPFNAITSLVSGLVDRVRETGRDAMRRTSQRGQRAAKSTAKRATSKARSTTGRSRAAAKRTAKRASSTAKRSTSRR
jgi:hemerythrin superfamily protein